MSHVACTPYERLNFTGLWKDECNREEARKIEPAQTTKKI